MGLTIVSAHFLNYSVAKDTSALFLLWSATDAQVLFQLIGPIMIIPIATPYYYT